MKCINKGTLRFRGRDIEQYDDFSVGVTCEGTLEKIEPITYNAKGRKRADLATPGEMSQLKSAVGSMSWAMGRATVSA